ncbi:MAG: acyl--CoA ligase, partial [Clostridia bacterium]|nr:acyl--CoA ligase [Clostridia bacterium]
MAISHRVQQSIDALVARDDVWIRRDVVEGYLATGAWTEDSFVDDLERHARERPHALAIMDEDGRRTTYGEYERRSRELALGLLDLGLVPGDRLAMQLPNSSEFCLTMMACARARIIPVFLHMPYTEHDLSYILELTGT